jgi:hypothetical protein
MEETTDVLMFDTETPIVALAAVCAVVLFTVLPSALIEAHTGRRTWLSRGDRVTVPPVPRSSLLIEVPIVVLLIGACQVIMVAAILSSISGLATRAIGATELVAFSLWMAHLVRSRRTALTDRGE